MRKYILLIFSIFTTQLFAANGHDKSIPDVPVELSAQILSLQSKNYLAITYKNFPGWHTYWKNPGDAGLPIKNKFFINKKPIELKSVEWPTPKKYIEEGNMLAYGYEDTYSLFYQIDKSQIPQLEKSSLTIKSKWLVCKHVCIPGQGEIEGKLKDGIFHYNQKKELTSKQQLKEALSNIPQKVEFPLNLDLVLTKGKDDQTLDLFYNLTLKNGLDKKAHQMLKHLNLLTPFPISPFDFEREKLHQDKKGNLYGRYKIQWDGEYTEPPINFPKDGKFKKPYTLNFLYSNPVTKKVEIISKSFNSFSLTAGEKMENFFNLVSPINTNPPNDNSGTKLESKISLSEDQENKSFWFYFLFAFLGGLILNIMPCVLPVISLKLFGLIKHSQSSNSVILKHNLFYSIGVLFCFGVLAAIVISLKSAGENVGWGFQLQSPSFIAAMIIILFVFALNLFGMFEFQTPGGKTLGSLQTNEGYLGDFLSGVLATILSTPCSAPFLGTALTFGFTTGGGVIFGIFMAIGLGLSFPFLLTGVFPKLIAFLPRPGNWMNHVKKALGVTLLLTILWLGDIFSSQIADVKDLIKLAIILALLLLAFAIRLKLSKNLVLNLFSFALPILLSLHLLTSPLEGSQAYKQDALLKEKMSKGLAWEKWSVAKMEEYKNQNELVFMDFTAKWCFTCKVNEKVVLETKDFKSLTEEYNLKLLLADWTKRDEVIGSWLKSQGMVGVPAYFIQKKNGELINLGETISIKKIKKNLAD